MKTHWKVMLGILIGFTISMLALAITKSHSTAMWLSGILGVGCLILWALTRNKNVTKVTNKLMTCFLVSAMAVMPSALLMAEDTYAGFNGQACYCIEVPPDDIRAAGAAESPTSNPRDYQSVVLNVVLDDTMVGPSPRIISMTHPNPESLVDWNTLNETLRRDWGIDLNQGQQYTKNGQPVTAADVPFKFSHDVTEQPFTLFPDRPQYEVALETTSELNGEFTRWETLTRFSAPTGTPINIQDTPEGVQTFYRLRIIKSPEGGQPQFQAAAGPIVLGCGIGLLVGVGVIGVLAVRACAKNKKKFQNITNQPSSELHFNLMPAR